MARAGTMESITELVPGDLVKPSLRLLAPLAEGAMGKVWIAEHLALGTEVAVKFLHGQLAREPVARLRFRREAAAAARIRSPHVVQILDYDVTDAGTPYIVMELLEGESLGALLTRRGTLDVVTTTAIVRQTCHALAKAHERGLVHRDIKPDNLFLVDGAEFPFVKVLDFGVAKDLAAGSPNTAEHIVGTPQFMAPEQMAGMPVGPQADVWSLGVLAHCCLTGTVPFDGETFAGMTEALETGRASQRLFADRSLPAEVASWLSRALDPDPTARHAEARALLLAIDGHGSPSRAISGGSGELDPAALGPTLRISARRARARRKKVLQAVWGTTCALAALCLILWMSWRAARAVHATQSRSLSTPSVTTDAPSAQPVDPD